MSNQPSAKYRADYKSPDFSITHIDLDFFLDDTKTNVTAVSQVIRQNNEATSLVLDGEDLKLVSLQINGTDWKDVEQSENTLTINNVPVSFTLTIKTEINPAGNTKLEGLYKSGDAFCTQCEAEGFRRITYYLDRPDVLAKFTTRVEADKATFPYLLSNGNRVDSGELEGGRHWVKWEDPHAKPSYLFALVAGDFDVLRDNL